MSYNYKLQATSYKTSVQEYKSTSTSKSKSKSYYIKAKRLKVKVKVESGKVVYHSITYHYHLSLGIAYSTFASLTYLTSNITSNIG